MPYRRNYRRRNMRPRRRVVKKRVGGTTALALVKRRVPRVPTAARVHYFKRTLNWSLIWSYSTTTSGLRITHNATSLSFVNNYLQALIPANTNCYISFGFAQQLGTLPAYTEFANLYDKYRILGYSTKIFPIYNNYSAPNQQYSLTGQTWTGYGGMGLPIVHSVIDYDDNLPESANDGGVDAIRQRSTYKTVRFDTSNGRFSRYVARPAVAVGVEDSAATSTAIPAMSKRAPVIDMGLTNVNHYGLKGIIEVYNTQNVASYVNFKCETTCYLAMYDSR